MMISLAGFFIFLIGFIIAILRNFFDIGLEETKGVAEETGCLTIGLLMISAINVLSGFYLSSAATTFAAGFNAYVFYDQHYWPKSGVLKQHEMEYILSKEEDFWVGEIPNRIEVTEDKGVCKIRDSRGEEKSYLISPPNADAHDIFKEFGVGRWKYRSENWLRHRSFLYSLFIKLRERM